MVKKRAGRRRPREKSDRFALIEKALRKQTKSNLI